MADVIDIDHGWQRLMELPETTVEVGTDVPYAKYLENGTPKMMPHPFMGPCFDRHHNYSKELAEAVGEVVGGRKPGPVMRELGEKVADDLHDEIEFRRLVKTGRLRDSMSFDVLQTEGEP